MRPLGSVGLWVWLLTLAALAGEAPTGGPKKTEPDAKKGKVKRVVVAQSKAPLLFGNDIIGELAEGTRLRLLEVREPWSLVRVTLGKNWFQGWIRTAMTVPDSLAEVNVKVAPATRSFVFENRTAPSGYQYLQVRVKFEPTEKSPSRVYFSFADEKTADLYLTYGRANKVLPYGFMRRRPMSKRRIFEAQERRQVLLLKADEPLIETYIFAVPLRARDFDLVLKDLVLQVETRR